MKLRPDTRTVRYLTERGWSADIVERRTGRISRDWLGIADVVAVHPEHGVLAVQATSASNVASRVKKVTAADALAVLRRCGVAVQVWGWYPDRDTPRVEDLS